uniref:uncharacterized protein LOC122599071 n=1 Tax=Erigeron canadensis TaxID=72917 RepID=UPI001CB9B4C5|nr:uncharacterized protein LOC122599071 [Erigeron canadensis]
MFIITQTSPIIFSHNFLESFFAGNLSGYQMVCSLAGVQMTTLPQEDVGCWKLAAQYIQKEFKEADEANLLDEEDMHVFGLRPMVDPLNLVSCNSCKKPVKVSQYATHAEICKSLSSLVDHTTENDVPVKKKPPRKERKKSQISISTQVESVGKPRRSAITKTTASNSHLDEQKATSLPVQPNGRESLNESQARSVKNVDGVNSLQTPGKFNDNHLQTKGMLSAPSPLATKIYYSQRNQRLRSAISQMYYRSTSSQHDHDLSNMQFSDSNTMPSINGYFHHSQNEYQPEKLGNHLPTMVEITDPFPAKSLEANLNESTKLLPVNFPDQFYVNNALGPQRAMGNSANDVLPASYLSDES